MPRRNYRKLYRNDLEDNDLEIKIDHPFLEDRPSSLLPKLTDREKIFFHYVQDGDVELVQEFLDLRPNFNINCQDFQGYTALTLAVKNEDLPMVERLIKYDDLHTNDSLLHAIKTGNVSIVKALLDRKGHGSMQNPCIEYVASADFTPDITPLILAAHEENYEMIQILIEQGHRIKKPHNPHCFCDRECKEKRTGESLTMTMGRFNAYKALASPAFICQSSPDPILTAFQLSKELSKCANMERELRAEYLQLSQKCSELGVGLIDKCRSSEEVGLLLCRKGGLVRGTLKNPPRFSRVHLAVEYQQKEFVAHPNAQQFLRGAWLADWQDWGSLKVAQKVARLVPRIIFLPVMAMLFYIAPNSKIVTPLRSPINKFLCFAASYIVFLIALFMQTSIERTSSVRGPPRTGLEWFVLLYVLGLLWRDVRLVYENGRRWYFSHLWNNFNLLMSFLFICAFTFWTYAEYDSWIKNNMFLPRKFWSQWDPTLIGEAFYSVAVVFAFGKIMYFFQIGNNVGPLQISFGRMLRDIVHFLVIFLVIMISFAMGLMRLYHYYTGQVQHVGNLELRQSNAFSSITKALRTEFWALYGYAPPEYADVVISEHHQRIGNTTRTIINRHRLTEAVGYTMHGMYTFIGCIILINMLIAMMSNTFTMVVENADLEWKFARSKVWLTFYESSPMPPPFNLMPTPAFIGRMIRWLLRRCTCKKDAMCNVTRCCYIDVDDPEKEVNEKMYQVLMAQLIQRYLSSKESEQGDQEASVADLELLRHEIHELRQLVEKLARSQTREIMDTSDSSVKF